MYGERERDRQTLELFLTHRSLFTRALANLYPSHVILPLDQVLIQSFSHPKLSQDTRRESFKLQCVPNRE